MALVPMRCLPLIAEADAAAATGGIEAALAVLRRLSTDEFATVLYEVPRGFPALAAALPAYPSADIQRAWAGNADSLLLQKTALFSRLAEAAYLRHTGAPLAGRRILDYGCGWGRMMRQMLYFTDPAGLTGVDPWTKSLEVCRETRVVGELVQIPYRPTSLPEAVHDIDFAVAFSVFTHIGEANAQEILSAVRGVMAPGGVFILTVRPVEYWRNRVGVIGEETVAAMTAEHDAGRWAFVPSGAVANAGSAEYGESSAPLPVLARLAETAGWRLAGTEWLLIDPMQVLVVLVADGRSVP